MIRILFILLLLSPLSRLSAEHLKGYNVAHVFLQFPGHKVNAEGIELFDKLQPNVFRFPGGTIANKYHYYKPGYGYSKGDMQQKENYIVEFVRLTKAMKSRPKVIYVMNLFEHFKGADEAALIKENMDALQYLIDHDMDVIAVELGNEFYLYAEIIGLPGSYTTNPEDNNEVDATAPKGNWFVRWLRTLSGKITGKGSSQQINSSAAENNFQKYERLSKIYAKKIGAVDPSIKLGIPIGNISNKKHKQYNEFVLSHFAFADAYVAHFYGTFNAKCGNDDEACIRQGLEWYIKSVMEPRLKEINASGKEVWVTEWNALKFGHYGDENPWLRNSKLHQEYTRKFIDIYNQYGVTISNFHKLAGPKTNAAYNAIDVDNGKCTTTAIYDVLLNYY